ncbi:MAG: NifU family protein [Clostridia bacterium]|nr:NifU family protein [Clostridia bacterium]
MEDYINNVLRPLLQGDGGEMEYLGSDEETVFVKLGGECSKCPIADRCLDWCADRIRADLGRQVSFAAQRVRPFFWDK